MNISRINQINFNGNLGFKYCDHDDQTETIKTKEIDANKVNMYYESAIAGAKPENPQGCDIFIKEEDAVYRAMYYSYDKENDNPRGMDHQFYQNWLKKAKDSNGTVNCPKDIVFVKLDKDFT